MSDVPVTAEARIGRKNAFAVRSGARRRDVPTAMRRVERRVAESIVEGYRFWVCDVLVRMEVVGRKSYDCYFAYKRCRIDTDAPERRGCLVNICLGADYLMLGSQHNVMLPGTNQ